jgi:hypothetical protein
MAEQFDEQVEILDRSGNVTIALDATRGDATVGGNGKGGDVRLFASGDVAQTEELAKIALDGQNARVQIGGNGKRGSAALYPASETAVDDDERAAIFLGSGDALVRAGGNDLNGDLTLFASGESATTDKTKATIHLNGGTGDARLGGRGVDGEVRIYAGDSTDLEDQDEAIILLDGSDAFLRLGGKGLNGDAALFPSGENTTDKDRATIYLDGSTANIRLGGPGQDGDLKLFPASTDDVNDDDNAAIVLNASDGFLRLGGGRSGTEGDLVMFDSNGSERIRLDAATGDIRLQAADVAEQFDVGPTALTPGTVVAFLDEETVVPTFDAYDPRVAGVIAGAGAYRPAMVLGCAPRDDRQAVSVMGKAFCMVDAAYGAIRRGDLLVASPTQGHAMRASDRLRAFGATLGKALRDFEGGRGTIPVLVTLR